MQNSLEAVVPTLDERDEAIPAIAASARRVGLAMALRRAIADKELVLYYQPQFDVENGSACGMEALARWFRRDGRLVDTAVFIAAAEKAQLIGALGSWVLQEACASAASAQAPPVDASSVGTQASCQTLCVNVSALQLDSSLAGIIRRIIERLHFPAGRLELEINEASPLAHAAPAIACLRELKEMGVRISIDDFGKAGPRFDRLSRLHVDRLKLDRSLISDAERRWKNVAILRSIISMGRDMGISVVAEGVETERQFMLLARLGCPQVQGHLLARPAPIETAREVAARRWGVRNVLPSPARALRRASHAC